MSSTKAKGRGLSYGDTAYVWLLTLSALRVEGPACPDPSALGGRVDPLDRHKTKERIERMNIMRSACSHSSLAMAC